MKKAAVLFIVLLFCIFASPASAKKTIAFMKTNENGTALNVIISDYRVTYDFDLSSEGETRIFTIDCRRYDKEDTRYVYRAFFYGPKGPRIVHYGVYKNSGNSFEIYSGDEHEKLFGLIKRMASGIKKEFNLDELAKKECSKRSEQYLKEEAAKNRREELRRKALPPPQNLLEELL